MKIKLIGLFCIFLTSTLLSHDHSTEFSYDCQENRQLTLHFNVKEQKKYQSTTITLNLYDPKKHKDYFFASYDIEVDVGFEKTVADGILSHLSEYLFGDRTKVKTDIIEYLESLRIVEEYKQKNVY